MLIISRSTGKLCDDGTELRVRSVSVQALTRSQLDTKVFPNLNDGIFSLGVKAEALRRLGRYQESFEARLKIPERLVLE